MEKRVVDGELVIDCMSARQARIRYKRQQETAVLYQYPIIARKIPHADGNQGRFGDWRTGLNCEFIIRGDTEEEVLANAWQFSPFEPPPFIPR